jgi:hypothetical protein
MKQIFDYNYYIKYHHLNKHSTLFTTINKMEEPKSKYIEKLLFQNILTFYEFLVKPPPSTI